MKTPEEYAQEQQAAQQAAMGQAMLPGMAQEITKGAMQQQAAPEQQSEG